MEMENALCGQLIVKIRSWLPLHSLGDASTYSNWAGSSLLQLLSAIKDRMIEVLDHLMITSPWRHGYIGLYNM